MPSVSEAEFRAEIARFCHLIYERGYVASTDGNISARLPDGHIMCTPTVCNKGFVRPEDMVIIDVKGTALKASGRHPARSRCTFLFMRCGRTLRLSSMPIRHA